MAAEIEADYTTGRTLYAQVRNSVSQVWNGAAFESYLTANIANYDIAMTEQGTASGLYVGDMPAAVAGFYNVIVKDRAGGSPAEADVTVATGAIEWTGTAVAAGVDASAIADGVWDELIAGHLGVGSTGAVLNGAGAAGDPWTTALPGAYGAGTAGSIVGSIGAAGVGLTAIPWNASWDVQVESEVADALAAYGASTLTAASVRTALGMAVANMDTQLSAISSVVNTIENETNDIGVAGAGLTAVPWNAAWDAQVESEVADALAAYGASTLTAAGVRTAVGLASANLDGQFAAVPTAIANADALLTRDMSAVTGEAARSPLNALRALRNKHTIIAGVLSVYKEDDTTLCWTAIVSSSASAQPVTGVDPT